MLMQAEQPAHRQQLVVHHRIRAPRKARILVKLRKVSKHMAPRKASHRAVNRAIQGNTELQEARQVVPGVV